MVLVAYLTIIGHVVVPHVVVCILVLLLAVRSTVVHNTILIGVDAFVSIAGISKLLHFERLLN